MKGNNKRISLWGIIRVLFLIENKFVLYNKEGSTKKKVK